MSGGPSPSPHWGDVRKSASEILNVRERVTQHRTRLAAMVDGVGRVLANPRFLVVFVAAHILWIVLNLPIYPWFQPWDPYPFPFLATVASVEAPFIALLVLIHQERNTRIDELREEVNLQVSLHVERELTMALRLLGEVQDKLGIRTEQDEELLRHLQEELNPERLMETLRKHLREAEHDESPTAP